MPRKLLDKAQRNKLKKRAEPFFGAALNYLKAKHRRRALHKLCAAVCGDKMRRAAAVRPKQRSGTGG